MSKLLRDLLAHRDVPGAACGIVSVCSAHLLILRAAMQTAKNYAAPLLIEATCNQVNQLGGYTGMRPEDFPQMVLPATLVLRHIERAREPYADACFGSLSASAATLT